MKKGKKKDDKPKTKEELLKYEIAEELGFMDKIKEGGWKSLTAKESGKIGGLMTKRKREKRLYNK
ncbi:small, acid-soluble spore protein, alpha/beta type [[Clostridium] colinum]|uniref:small, acid-soluble spore protein, alpha/beta type n=1 Tax=[Clostridium] colinum TaxID=36835 RepID=UPI0020253414|nr:small, acid-soluble spore protein, alpha/beta type [[Clostridium] colinum]